ncbi:nucleotide-binding domain-containing protein [Enterococcus casseliflavus]|uniref:nucleotide-binding domain-containing protein n=1 Tax=Enterococcus casseliflavus TaxID=37734 RepID=UPI0035CAFB20
MYDVSKELEKFYRKKVVLSAKEQNELREKRRFNIKRLKEGLSEYNLEKNTNYKIAEERIQGSMAMHTITQNDKRDYDIDVGIVFEEDNLNDLGPLSTRNMVANSLERKTKQFAEKPEVKTSCVRLKYSSTGYHVDFAVFKRYKEVPTDEEYSYKHSGSTWSVRHIKELELWFSEKIKDKGDELRKVIRLSKMFCKSRESWKNMPSGLVQTVICEENFVENYLRLDETFYYTMKNIVNRLNSSLEVYAPVDNGRPLVNREIDYQRMKNWKNKLESQLSTLEILFDDDCTYENAITAWGNFFDHSYFGELRNVVKQQNFTDTEEFIVDLYPILEQYDVTIDCQVSGKGFSLMTLQRYMDVFAPRLDKFIPPKFKIKCSIQSTNCPSYDKVLWKVLNVGPEAEKRNNIRGQIKDRGSKITEDTLFRGDHYIECYLIKDSVCVGIGHVNVPIGGN